MRQLFRAGLAGATLAALMVGPAQGGWAGQPAGPPLVVIETPATPAFSTPLGGGQGYGYAPSTFWARPGFQLRADDDGTVSSPYRPGSLNAQLPRYGYFPTGEGPYVFPPRFAR